jgi:hypothetical protein
MKPPARAVMQSRPRSEDEFDIVQWFAFGDTRPQCPAIEQAAVFQGEHQPIAPAVQLSRPHQQAQRIRRAVGHINHHLRSNAGVPSVCSASRPRCWRNACDCFLQGWHHINVAQTIAMFDRQLAEVRYPTGTKSAAKQACLATLLSNFNMVSGWLRA